MLFLLGLSSCFAAEVDIKTENGRTVKEKLNRLDGNPISELELKNSAVAVIGADGRVLYTGHAAPANDAAKPIDASTQNIKKWNGEKIDIKSVREVNIISMNDCGFCTRAKNLAYKTFGMGGKVKVKVYLVPDQDLENDTVKQNMLQKFGLAQDTTFPMISITDGNNVCWFIGGFLDFDRLINGKAEEEAPVGTSQNVSSVQDQVIDTSMGQVDFAHQDIPTRLYQSGMPYVEPLQVEIFGASYCGPCQTAKQIAIRNFGAERLKFNDIKKRTPESNDYSTISNNILRVVRSKYTGMPRISVICKGENGPERFFLGNYDILQRFINSRGRIAPNVMPVVAQSGYSTRQRAQQDNTGRKRQPAGNFLDNIWRQGWNRR